MMAVGIKPAATFNRLLKFHCDGKRNPPLKPTCNKCRHYHITWDKDRPHGCRALGFKSRRLPMEAVRASTPGMECQLFREKKKKIAKGG